MTKHINKTLIFLFTLLTFSLKGQVRLPLFEEPTRLDSINSEIAEESMPMPYLDGQKMYFVRTYVDGDAKQRKRAQDVWSSLRRQNIWSFPVNVFDEINDLGNNAIIGTSKDGNRVYVFNSIQTRRKLAKGIAITEKQEDGSWSDLKKIEIEGFKIGQSFYSFYVNPDEDILLICMPPDNKTINEDIFVSLKKDGKWGKVIHLGSIINTDDYELSPYIADDKKTLYFSSSGHEGYGSADVFMSYRLDDSWTNWSVPKNLGNRINSNGFDAYFIIGNNKEVFFTSNRDQEYSDIYATKIINGRVEELAEESEENEEETGELETEEVEVSSVFILDKLPADSVKLEIYDADGNFVEEVVTDAYGQFTYTKLDPEEVYIIKIAEQDVDDYIGSNIYFLDEEGNKAERYVLTDEGFVEEGDSEFKEKVSGVLATKKKPLNNNALVVYNEEGAAVDTIYTDEEGKFNYTKLELDKQYTIRPIDANDDDMGAFEIVLEESDSLGEVTGVISTKPQPIANTELVIRDANNFPIDTVTTDDEGNFEYLKLAADEEYSIIPVEELEEEVIDEVELILIDEDGDVVMVSDSAFENSFTIISPEPSEQLLELKAQIESTIEEVEAEDKGSLLPTELVEINLGEVTINSVVIMDGVPAANKKLEIYDQTRTLSEVTETDDEGRFSYKKRNSNEVYLIRIVGRDEQSSIESDIYFLDMNGDKTNRYVLTDEGLFAESGDSEYKEFVKGVLEYKEQPLKNNALVVFDEEGAAIDTIYTDEEGKFEYTKLEMDKTYTIRPIDASDEDMGDFNLVLEASDSTQAEISGTISTKAQPIQNTELLVLDRNDFAIDTVTTDDDGEFRYLKLAVDQEYSIKPIELEEEVIEDVALILIDDEGEVITSSESVSEDNSFTISSPDPSPQLVKLQAKIEETIIEEIALDDPSELIELDFTSVETSSIVLIGELPAADIKVGVYDPSKTLVKETRTNSDGRFNYTKTNSEEIYLVKILTDDEENPIGSNVYFVDEEGNKTGRYLLTEEGFFAESGSSTYQEFVEGVLEYKEQPLKNNALGVFDTADEIVDTTYTDEFGRFEFTKPNVDEEYRIRPIGVSDKDMIDYELILEVTKDLADIKGTISTKPQPIANTDLVVLDRNDFALDTVTTDDDGEFKYLKLAADQEYSIVPVEIEEEEIEEIELILIDEDGELLIAGDDQFSFTSPEPSPQLVKLQAKIEETKLEEIVLDDSSELMEFDFDEVVVNGVVLVDEKPAQDIEIEIYDPSKTLVKKLKTNSEGEFTYSKTDSAETYLVKIVGRDQESVVNSNIYFLDEKGEKTGRYLLTEEGYFAEVGESPFTKLVEGVLEYKEQPLKNNALGVFDTADEIVDTTYTDEFGRFEFTKPNVDEEYRIRPIGVSDKDMIDYELILEVTKDLADIKGTISTKPQPIANTDLVVLDRNDFALDTVTTDNDGEFQYLKLAVDQEYSIVPIDLEEEVVEEVELVLIDDSGEIVITGEDQFTFSEPEPSEQLVQLKLKIEETIIEEIALEEVAEEVLIPEDLEDDLVLIEEEKTEKKEVEQEKEREESKELPKETSSQSAGSADEKEETPKTQTKETKEEIKESEKKTGITIRPVGSDSIQSGKGDYVIYFGFNKWTLDNEDQQTLLTVTQLLKSNKEVNAEIFGHTDNIGSEAVNLRVAQLRSKSVKNFLIRNGIDPNRLTVTAIGEVSPVADNSTPSGRALNRRAEVAIGELGRLLSDDFKQEVAEKLGKDAKYVVYFGFNKWILESDDEQTLLEVTKLLQKDVEAKAEIFGHTDSVGSEAVNLRVAKLRSLSARNFLIRNGIAVDRLQVTSVGEAEPIADNKTKEGRAKNRRAEVIIKN